MGKKKKSRGPDRPWLFDLQDVDGDRLEVVVFDDGSATLTFTTTADDMKNSIIAPDRSQLAQLRDFLTAALAVSGR